MGTGVLEQISTLIEEKHTHFSGAACLPGVGALVSLGTERKRHVDVEEIGVHCPFCRYDGSRVVDSRTTDDGTAIRRRRECPQCGRRFTTVETASLMVCKRSGALELFQREKVIVGVKRACQGRPVTDDDLALLAQQVEESIRATGQAVVNSHDIGLAILGPLRELDEIAYLRFASVYSDFSSLDDFESAIRDLRSRPVKHA